MNARPLLFLGLLSVGCGAASAPDPLVNLPAGCKPMLSQCLAVQQICVAGPACQACPDGQYATSRGVCSPLGTPTVHDFAMFTADSGQEILGLCQSWTLNNPTELWINAVELDQDEASHHSNWLFVPDDQFNGPDGVWRCRDRAYDELAAALVGGVLYAQSTQAPHEVQKFPNGAAVRIPPYSRIIGDVHILNATLAPVTGHARLSLYPVPLADVKIKLAPFNVGFSELTIPPQEASRSQGSCDLDASFQSAFNHGVDAKVYYILPHFHALGFHFFVSRVGGPQDGATIFDSEGGVGEARGRAFDPPIDLTGTTGLHFGCDFNNNTDQTVHWGFGNQEMCELLGFSDSPLAWASQVATIVPDTVDAPAPKDAPLPAYTGACSTVAFDYDFTKAGGPGPM